MPDSRLLLARAVYAEMRHALGGTSDIQPQSLLNDVLEEVSSMHEWDFLARGEAFIDLRGSVGFSGWSWTASTKTLFDPTASGLLADYVRYATDVARITAGGTNGSYTIASRVDDDTVTLNESIASGDLAATVGGRILPRAHPLPDDFDSLLEAGFVDNTSHLAMGSTQSVARAQRNEFIQNIAYRGSVEWDSHTTPMLRIDPSPETAKKSAISIAYRKRLTLVGTDGDEINAPRYMHRLIKDVARALVRGLEMPQEFGEFSDQMDRIKQGSVFMNARNADGGSQIDLGRVSAGGHVPRSAIRRDFPPTTISVTGP